jgi:hypothetical protein
MNERIKQLAVEAAEYAVVTPSEVNLESETEDAKVTIPANFIEKLAELIVGECVQVAVKQQQWVEDMMPTAFSEADQTWNKARIQQSERIIDKIKEHFGVEE